MAEHTAIPWEIESDGTTIVMDGQCVIVGPAPDGAGIGVERANAALIVRAVNNHAALLHALRDLLRQVETRKNAATFERGTAREAITQAEREG